MLSPTGIVDAKEDASRDDQSSFTNSSADAK